MNDDLLSFVTNQLEQELWDTRSLGQRIVRNGGIPGLNLSGEDFAKVHQPDVRRAELRLEFLNTTVRPYLGTAGPTGLIAEQQLRLIGAEFANKRGYQPEWAPDA
jgi:hypothetical protein